GERPALSPFLAKPPRVVGARAPPGTRADPLEQRLRPGPQPDDVAAFAKGLPGRRVEDGGGSDADDRGRFDPESLVEGVRFGQVEDVLAFGGPNLGRLAAGLAAQEVVVVEV